MSQHRTKLAAAIEAYPWSVPPYQVYPMSRRMRWMIVFYYWCMITTGSIIFARTFVLVGSTVLQYTWYRVPTKNRCVFMSSYRRGARTAVFCATLQEELYISCASKVKTNQLISWVSANYLGPNYLVSSTPHKPNQPNKRQSYPNPIPSINYTLCIYRYLSIYMCLERETYLTFWIRTDYFILLHPSFAKTITNQPTQANPTVTN